MFFVSRVPTTWKSSWAAWLEAQLPDGSDAVLGQRGVHHRIDVLAVEFERTRAFA
jgi:hypothetical protein